MQHYEEVTEIRAKNWKKLKAKQKYKVSEIMFGVVCAHYKEHGHMPADAELEKLAKKAFNRIQGCGPQVTYETFYDVFLKKQTRFAERIEKNDLPEPPKPKVKKTEAEKLAIKRAARKRKKTKRARMARLTAQEQELLPWQDDRYLFIAGYTSGGAPYGVTWEQMGLEPGEDLEHWQREESYEGPDLWEDLQPPEEPGFWEDPEFYQELEPPEEPE